MKRLSKSEIAMMALGAIVALLIMWRFGFRPMIWPDI
jgi:hypothetical protein